MRAEKSDVVQFISITSCLCFVHAQVTLAKGRLSWRETEGYRWVLRRMRKISTFTRYSSTNTHSTTPTGLLVLDPSCMAAENLLKLNTRPPREIELYGTGNTRPVRCFLWVPSEADLGIWCLRKQRKKFYLAQGYDHEAPSVRTRWKKWWL